MAGFKGGPFSAFEDGRSHQATLWAENLQPTVGNPLVAAARIMPFGRGALVAASSWNYRAQRLICRDVARRGLSDVAIR